MKHLSATSRIESICFFDDKRRRLTDDVGASIRDGRFGVFCGMSCMMVQSGLDR